MKYYLIAQIALITGVACTPAIRPCLSPRHPVVLEHPNLYEELVTFGENEDIRAVEEGWKDMLHDLTMEEVFERINKVKKKIKGGETMNEFLNFEDFGNFAAKEQKKTKKDKPFKERTSFSVFENEDVFDELEDENTFDVLEHDENYSLRTKGVYSLHLDTVKQFSGYFDIRDVDKHFFYWFFESRNDPSTDPIILWLNGGPGCSSDGGLFFELGPSSINSELKPVFNPYSWNSNASVIFLDQPVGVGYSYAGEEDVDTSGKAAADVYVFLELFFKKFPKFLNNDFHLSGESYAGHYVPRIAAEIIRHPERSFELKSILVGNGAVDSSYQRTFDQKMICGEGGMDILSPEDCTKMEDNLGRCIVLSDLCSIANNVLTCVPSDYYCLKAYGALLDLHLNPYDLRMPCENDYLCYTDMFLVSDYLNQTFVKQALGVAEDLDYQLCNREVNARFGYAYDKVQPFNRFIAEVLDYGIPVLHYAGDKDFVCHWLGYNAVSDKIKFKGQEEFKASEFSPWKVDGKEVGAVRGAGGLTFLRVYDSGHMVPHDQPEVALAMLNTWVSGGYGFGE